MISNEFAKHTQYSKNKIFTYEKQIMNLVKKDDNEDLKITNLKNVVELMKKDIACGHFSDIIEQKNKEKLINIYERIIQDYYELRYQEKKKLKDKMKTYYDTNTCVKHNMKIRIQLFKYQKLLKTETDPIKRISYQYLINIFKKLVR